MSHEVILLNDVPNHNVTQEDITYTARYPGPYVVKSNLIHSQISCIVLDWFRFITDNKAFFEYFENFVDENTKVVGISNTFLYPVIKNEKINDSSGFSELNKKSASKKNLEPGEETAASYSLYLWEDSNEKLNDWLSRLRAVLDKYNPDAKIILGGARSTRIMAMGHLAPDDYCVRKYVDYIVIGMADYATPRLVDKIKRNEEIEVTFERHGIKYIMCDRDPWITPQEYIPVTVYDESDCLKPSHWPGLEIGRGCAFNCKYCYYEKRFSNKKPLAVLSDELKKNYYEFGTTGYNITADCFNDNRRFVGEWAEMTAQLPFKIEWASYVRVDPFNKWPEMIDEMIESGFRAGWYGIETLSHEAGKACGKGLKPERVKELLALIKSKGEVWTSAYFILGLPKETPETLEQTLQYLKTQKVIDEIGTSILDVGPFVEELSGIVDFSDHTRNPEKYGFKRLEWEPEFYWEHETMNLNQAFDSWVRWKAEMADHTYTRFGGSAHAEYIRIRDLGLDHRQTVVYLKTKFKAGSKMINIDRKKKRQFKDYVVKLSRQNVVDYYINFLKTNKVRDAQSYSFHTS